MVGDGVGGVDVGARVGRLDGASLGRAVVGDGLGTAVVGGTGLPTMMVVDGVGNADGVHQSIGACVAVGRPVGQWPPCALATGGKGSSDCPRASSSASNAAAKASPAGCAPPPGLIRFLPRVIIRLPGPRESLVPVSGGGGGGGMLVMSFVRQARLARARARNSPFGRLCARR